MAEKKTATCVSVARKIAKSIGSAVTQSVSQNWEFAQFAALAVRDGISKSDAFTTLKLAISGTEEVSEGSEYDSRIKYAKRRAGMGFRVLKGGSGGKAAHPRHSEILISWASDERKKGNGLETVYADVRSSRVTVKNTIRLTNLLAKMSYEESLPIFTKTFSDQIEQAKLVESFQEQEA